MNWKSLSDKAYQKEIERCIETYYRGSVKRERPLPCEGKIRYPTRQAAEYDRLQMARRPRRRPQRKNLGSYKCQDCSYWHLGRHTSE